MQLVRTLALAAAAAVLCASRGATAQENTGAPTTTPPTTTPPTTAPPTNQPTTPAPTPASSPATPTGAPNPASGDASAAPAPGGAVATLKEEENPASGFWILSVTSSSSDVAVDIDGVKVSAKATTEGATPLPTSTISPKLRVVVDKSTKKLDMTNIKSTTLTELQIALYEETPAQAVLSLPKDGLKGLTALTSATFEKIKFEQTALELRVPTSLAYLKIATTNLEDLSLVDATNLNSVELKDGEFKQLPFFLYQRSYANFNITMNGVKINAGVTDLSSKEHENAVHNLNGSDAKKNFEFREQCPTEIPTSNHIVCVNGSRSDIRVFNEVDNSDNETPAPTTPSVTETPAPSQTLLVRDSSNSDTTLTVIVVVIAVVAAVLAYFVARRYFCTAKSMSRSPRLNDRTVGLISKDESHAGNNKLSFISSDDALRQIRLEQQDVSVNKSVGTGRLWVGDFSGRKVMIKRIEAESSDSYATKALITQARALAPVSHPNIVSLVGVTWVQGTDFGVVAEFMDKGTLKALLMDLDAELDLQSKLHMCLDIAQALKYLHSSEHNMYMKRLTSRKVLVNAAMECKLNLYECHPCTNKIEYPEVFGAGEMAWEAPELITRTGVLDPRKINIFSLGVIMGEIMTRASPYQSAVDAVGHTLADLELMKRIKRQESLLPHENRHEFTELPFVLRDVITRCLSNQPLSRPTAEEVVQCLESAKSFSERVGSTTSL